MNLKKGNTKTFIFKIKDSDEYLLTHLSEAIAIKFMVKKNKDDLDVNAIISKNLTNGISINVPSTGYITVVVNSTDANVDTGKYWVGLQIEFSSTNKVEVDLKENKQIIDTIDINQDIIR